MMTEIAFYAISAIILSSALAVVLLRNVIHSALFLGVALAGVAGLFAMLGADFLSAAQVLIYVSGIAVLILFVVMLSGRASDLLMRQVNEQWPAAVIVSGIMLYTLSRLLPAMEVPAKGTLGPTTDALGRLLLGDLAFPFELISIVLLVALVGAVYFSRGDDAPVRHAGETAPSETTAKEPADA